MKPFFSVRSVRLFVYPLLLGLSKAGSFDAFAQPQLLMHLKLNEESAANRTVLTDASGNGNPGTTNKSVPMSTATLCYSTTESAGSNNLWIRPGCNLYFTDPLHARPYWKRGKTTQQPSQHVYYFDMKTRKAIPVATNLQQPNGIIGTPDGKTLFDKDGKRSQTSQFPKAGPPMSHSPARIAGCCSQRPARRCTASKCACKGCSSRAHQLSTPKRGSSSPNEATRSYRTLRFNGVSAFCDTPRRFAATPGWPAPVDFGHTFREPFHSTFSCPEAKAGESPAVRFRRSPSLEFLFPTVLFLIET